MAAEMDQKKKKKSKAHRTTLFWTQTKVYYSYGVSPAEEVHIYNYLCLQATIICPGDSSTPVARQPGESLSAPPDGRKKEVTNMTCPTI